MLMSPRDIEFQDDTWPHPIALLAAKDLVVAARKRGVGKRCQVRVWPRWEFPRYEVGLWRGTGPGYAVTMLHETEGRIRFVFSTPVEAEALGDYCANG